MGLTLITPPSTLAVPLADAKAWCKVEHNSEEALLTSLIRAATGKIEKLTGRGLIEQVWQLTLTEFADEIELPLAPVISVDAVDYFDTDEVAQTASAALYSLDLTSAPQRLVLDTDAVWPDLGDTLNPVRISFTVGFEDGVPDDLITALLALVASWHRDRETLGGALPPGVWELIAPYRRIRI